MDFPPGRRKVNIYGKGARKVHVHDLFDVAAPSPVDATTTTFTSHVPALPRPGQATNTSHIELENEVRGAAKQQSHGRKGDPSTATSPWPLTATHSTMFDLHSSEEEPASLRPKPPLKKRKIASAKSKQTENAVKVDKPPKGVMTKMNGLRAMNESGKEKLQSKSTNVNFTLERSDSANAAPRMKRPFRGVTTSRSISPGDLVRPRAPRSKQPQLSIVSSPESSDSSSRSRPSQRSSPKRKRRVSDESLLASPTLSEVHLTALRLTPDSSSQRSHVSSDDEDIGDAPTKPAEKSRKRLVDRLDAPRTQTRDIISRTASLNARERQEQHSSQTKGGAAPPGRISASRPTKDVPHLEKQLSDVSVAASSGRPRPTYAKQRTYLSEMVDSLESYPAPNSQTSSQEIHSQAVSFTSVASRMELDTGDSDETDAFSQIKSIHELRRGGALRKFDLDLDTILEDVESGSKSRRISGLLQLIPKLNELSSLRHFQDSSNLQRLLDCANGSLDEVSGTLVALVLHCVVLAESSSPRVVLQILNTLYKLSPRLVSEPKSLTKLAKDRSQNLSKVLVKEISEFEEKRSRLLGQPCMAVNKTILGSVEAALRNLINLKEPFPALPRVLLDEILSTFATTLDMIEGGGMAKQLETIRLLLSLLEIAWATNHGAAGSSLSTVCVAELGESVARVMKEAHQSQPQLEQSCLRLIVSLSNNDAAACDALVDGRLIDTVFQVIDERFLKLARHAEQKQEFDHAQLESVILAVGCLLNFAECADAARVRMLGLMADGKNMVDRLVDIFNTHVDQASEAMTIDQTQILVAFGYISALLCTLCLNPTASHRIAQSTNGKGLSPLFGAADTFLDHLQTVEAALGKEDCSPTGFTERFTTVLETVKQQAG
ncbi:uncharacterized protein A1O5_00154 [Cladophialophora psammophila CBS 110553]|uniref:Wings apart-like protein C-terminal domain-containing protein n=1 Tax=Cladophialophora psammophila CBS 110553 TaxID=1182543 RepID=W9X565_9EURO|nr:uncharacterized protein A1O5_00154 [Cladophialophora psammophila CBS 110553]EXJ75647.1 hypothetical protein A1O5_00154 [Cladophialophora psammophila CBS 110553]